MSGLTLRQRLVKRGFDFVAAAAGLIILCPVIAVGWLAATFSSNANGFYIQSRVGKNGRLFPLIKLRSMRIEPGISNTVTTSGDVRITKVGRILRKLKIDELPQLINVLVGQMSLVGPRPDVPGFADELSGEDRIILSVLPGITGPASIKFRNEEEILAKVPNPETHNRDVIWPEKIRINREYVEEYSFWKDLRYLLQTVLGSPQA